MAFTYSNLGPKWTFDWMSYIEDDPGDSRATVFLYPRGGGQETYGYDDDLGVYERHIRTRGDLERISDDPIAYRLRLPDGSTETYAYPDGASSFPRRVFLTESMDARGNALRFHYDGMKLVAVEDAIGRQTVVGYTHPNGSFQDHLRPRPLRSHRASVLQRGGAARVDHGRHRHGVRVRVRRRRLHHLPHDALRPHGVPLRRAAGLTGFGVDRWLEAVDPLGGRERLEFLMQYDGIAPQEAPEASRRIGPGSSTATSSSGTRSTGASSRWRGTRATTRRRT